MQWCSSLFPATLLLKRGRPQRRDRGDLEGKPLQLSRRYPGARLPCNRKSSREQVEWFHSTHQTHHLSRECTALTVRCERSIAMNPIQISSLTTVSRGQRSPLFIGLLALILLLMSMPGTVSAAPTHP